MKYTIAIIILFVTLIGSLTAECIQELVLTGEQLVAIDKDPRLEYYVEIDSKFYRLADAKLTPERKYLVHVLPQPVTRDYNQKYLQYYDYKRLNEYLAAKASVFEAHGYQLTVIGHSVENRDLYALYPKNISRDKKTIVMFCRHHGDEGTANWIVEGFLDKVYANGNSQWFQQYQLLLYPMVNPDGTEKKTRYNANQRDLNRVWKREDADEVVFIRRHLLSMLEQIDKQQVVIALDMHGSFVEDFIYRVPRHFAGLDFFELQGKFINQLAIVDNWQNGAYKLSTGNPGMARIYLVEKYRHNALTHETIRNIPLKNKQNRTIKSLKQQGEAIYQTINVFSD